MDVSMDNSRASSVEPHDVSNLNINENDQKPTKKASISDDEENSNLSSGNFEGDSNKTRQRRGRKAGSNQNKPGNGNRGDTKSNSTSVSTFDNRPKLRLGKQSSLEDSGNDVPMTGTVFPNWFEHILNCSTLSYQTNPYFIQLNQYMTTDCLLI